MHIVLFQKKSIPTPWKLIRNSKGKGHLKKAKILETKDKAKLDFVGGGGEGGLKKKTLWCGGK